MNTFRKAYKELSFYEVEHVNQIKDAAERLERLIVQAREGKYHSRDGDQLRHIALAMTNLEQAVMWATKAYT